LSEHQESVESQFFASDDRGLPVHIDDRGPLARKLLVSVKRMTRMINTCIKIFRVGGWAPFSVFVIHVISGQVFKVYKLWPSFDVPMHFVGGLAFAFFVSQCFRELPRGMVQRSRSVVLELLLIGSLTATAAVFWEFFEFSLDQLLQKNIQVSLANTMKDLAMGIIGSTTFIAIRAKQLRLGSSELKEITKDWLEGKAA
jgi:hypothetical protein